MLPVLIGGQVPTLTTQVTGALTQAFQAGGLSAAQAQAAAQAAAPRAVATIAALRPTPAQVTSRIAFLTDPATTNRAPESFTDVPELKASYNTTYELGYKGLVGQRARVALDLWHQRRGDVGGASALATPTVFFDATNVGAYLGPQIAAALVGAGVPQAAAAAVAPQVATGLARTVAPLPLGIVTFANGNTNATDILATYRTFNQTITIRGLDLAVDYLVTPRLTLAGSYGYQGDAGDTDSTATVFEEVRGPDGNFLMLNAPSHRGTLALRLEPLGDAGFGGELRTRYNNAFPVNSGFFASGVRFPDPDLPGQTYTYNSVRTNVLLDATVSYAFQLGGRRALVSLSATNLLDREEAWTFAGTPAIRRMVISRLQYRF